MKDLNHIIVVLVEKKRAAMWLTEAFGKIPLMIVNDVHAFLRLTYTH